MIPDNVRDAHLGHGRNTGGPTPPVPRVFPGRSGKLHDDGVKSLQGLQPHVGVVKANAREIQFGWVVLGAGGPAEKVDLGLFRIPCP